MSRSSERRRRPLPAMGSGLGCGRGACRLSNRGRGNVGSGDGDPVLVQPVGETLAAPSLLQGVRVPVRKSAARSFLAGRNGGVASAAPETRTRKGTETHDDASRRLSRAAPATLAPIGANERRKKPLLTSLGHSRGTVRAQSGASKILRPPRNARPSYCARPDSNGRPAGSKPEDPTHSAHLYPSQPRPDATCGQSPRCEMGCDGLGVGTVGAQSAVSAPEPQRRTEEHYAASA